MNEKERFIVELDQRTALWGRKKANAGVRVELDGADTVLAKIDVKVAENALKRIAKKKDELSGAKKPDVEYPALAGVLGKDEDPTVEVPKKRVHKNPKALFALAPVKDVEEKEKHDV